MSRQRLYGMDLRSAHKGKEKLCFSLARRFGGGDSSLPGAKPGQAEFSEKTGGTVLPFSLRKQRKNQKYLRLSRKKFPRMASLESRNCRHEFFLNDAVGLEARERPEDWEAMQHASKDGKARHPSSEVLGHAKDALHAFSLLASSWDCGLGQVPRAAVAGSPCGPLVNKFFFCLDEEHKLICFGAVASLVLYQ